MITSAALLSGCVSTQMGRIGADDGSDPCRAQVVALDSTGDFFGEDIIRGAAVGALGGAALGALIAAASGGNSRNIAAGAGIGALAGGLTGAAAGYYSARQRQASDQASLNMAIANDLSLENAQLDRTQLAFNQLMDCRFGTAQRIRTAYRNGQMTRPQAEAQLANQRALAQRDVQLAQSINGRITSRGDQFDVAIENVAPGTKQQVQAGARVSAPQPLQARAAVPLKLRPDAASPEVAQVSPRESVTVTPAGGGFALVETSAGVRGYAPASAFPEVRNTAARVQPAANDNDVRSLAATNIARRDNFTESVSNAQRLAQGQGFELAAS
ncbi:hypothetical protein [Falsiroseomonas sp. HW251]|uniref:hypothetical protein n=1 Tax=Falsiroseomonas sp. HW251 TaxID=3390998 RepID=UPI003D317CA0